MNPRVQLGSWPYVDIVLVKDYEQSQMMKGKKRCFVRIHMDIPIKDTDVDTIDDLLKAADHEGVLKKVKENTPSNPDPNSTGMATLKAALGL